MNDIIQIDTINQAAEIFGLGKPKHPLVMVCWHKDMVDIPHDVRIALNLYQIIYKDCKTGSLQYGRNSYDFEEGTLMFTEPGQVLVAPDSDECLVGGGWSLFFHPDIIRKSNLGTHICDYSFFSYDVNEALHISDDERNIISDIRDKIINEYQQNIDKHSQKLIISNVELLLDYCTRYYDRQFYIRENLNKDIVTRFEDLLREYYKEKKFIEQGVPNVKYCGKELNMSPNYLSDLLKKETGSNAQDHIHHFVMDIAKTNLLNSNEAVSQIAYSLGFEYPQHFSKLFKNKIGVTPQEYRRQN